MFVPSLSWQNDRVFPIKMAQKYRILLTTCPWTVCPEPVLANFRVSKKQMKTRRLQLSRCAAARTRTRTGATATAPAWTAAARKRRSLQCDENGLFSRAAFPLQLKGTRSPAKTGSGQTCTCIQRKTQRQPRQRIVFFKMICYVLLRFVLLCYVLFCFVLFCFGRRRARTPSSSRHRALT